MFANFPLNGGGRPLIELLSDEAVLRKIGAATGNTNSDDCVSALRALNLDDDFWMYEFKVGRRAGGTGDGAVGPLLSNGMHTRPVGQLPHPTPGPPLSGTLARGPFLRGHGLGRACRGRDRRPLPLIGHPGGLPCRRRPPACARAQVVPCAKSYSHKWTLCPCAHAGETARRRCPRTVNYRAVLCPLVKAVSAGRGGGGRWEGVSCRGVRFAAASERWGLAGCLACSL